MAGSEGCDHRALAAVRQALFDRLSREQQNPGNVPPPGRPVVAPPMWSWMNEAVAEAAIVFSRTVPLVHEDPDTAVDVVDIGRATEQELRGITTDVAHRPFSLWSEHAWRASILTRDGGTTHVAMVNHHKPKTLSYSPRPSA